MTAILFAIFTLIAAPTTSNAETPARSTTTAPSSTTATAPMKTTASAPAKSTQPVAVAAPNQGTAASSTAPVGSAGKTPTSSEAGKSESGYKIKVLKDLFEIEGTNLPWKAVGWLLGAALLLVAIYLIAQHFKPEKKATGTGIVFILLAALGGAAVTGLVLGRGVIKVASQDNIAAAKMQALETVVKERDRSIYDLKMRARATEVEKDRLISELTASTRAAQAELSALRVNSQNVAALNDRIADRDRALAEIRSRSHDLESQNHDLTKAAADAREEMLRTKYSHQLLFDILLIAVLVPFSLASLYFMTRITLSRHINPHNMKADMSVSLTVGSTEINARGLFWDSRQLLDVVMSAAKADRNKQP